MNKHITVAVLLLSLATLQTKAQKPDSIYFYKDGAIVYGEATTQIDSLTFLPTNHYDLQRSEAIYEELASHPELSIFTSMLLRTGFATNLINKTIWAPTNEAFQGLSPQELTDLNLARRILNNQMSFMPYTSASSLFNNGKVVMYSGKRFNISKTDAGYELAGNRLVKTDILLQKCVIHIVEGRNPYSLNLWEYIQEAEGLDSLRTYIRSITTMEQYTNVWLNGISRDTVTLPKCDLLDYLAKINLEDSIYTVLLPENEVFQEAFNRLYPYCKTTVGITAQTDAAKWMILRELFFRNKQVLPISNDELYSVGGTKYEHPDSLFLGASTPIELSNGLAYRVSHLKAFENGFQKRPIRLEAEDKIKNKVVAENYSMATAWNRNPAFDISNGKYIVCSPTTSSSLSPLNVIVSLLNTFAMKYNVYVVFVPTYAYDTTDLRPYKLNFYLGTNGDAASTYPTYAILNTTPLLTNPTTMTKILVAEKLDLTSSNIQRDPNLASKYVLKIRNMGGMTTTEIKNFNRTMRIDQILLEPVE